MDIGQMLMEAIGRKQRVGMENARLMTQNAQANARMRMQNKMANQRQQAAMEIAGLKSAEKERDYFRKRSDALSDYERKMKGTRDLLDYKEKLYRGRPGKPVPPMKVMEGSKIFYGDKEYDPMQYAEEYDVPMIVSPKNIGGSYPNVLGDVTDPIEDILAKNRRGQ